MILTTPESKREASAALATYAVNGAAGRNVGDPVHEQVTEGRRQQYERAVAAKQAWALAMKAGYSSCGDLAHWVLCRLGCRDERLVNRNDDHGAHPWLPGANTTRLGQNALARRSGAPALGSVVMINNSLGGHVFVVTAIEDDGVTMTTAEYGQPYGRQHTRIYDPVKRAFDSSPLLWWIDVGDVECTAEYAPPGTDAQPEKQPAKGGAGVMSVAEMQAILRRLGHNPGAVDGKAGLRTIAAIRAFQVKAGLQADGVAGPKTKAALALAVKAA